MFPASHRRGIGLLCVAAVSLPRGAHAGDPRWHASIRVDDGSREGMRVDVIAPTEAECRAGLLRHLSALTIDDRLPLLVPRTTADAGARYRHASARASKR